MGKGCSVSQPGTCIRIIGQLFKIPLLGSHGQQFWFNCFGVERWYLYVFEALQMIGGSQCKNVGSETQERSFSVLSVLIWVEESGILGDKVGWGSRWPVRYATKDAAWGCRETWAKLLPSGQQRLPQSQASLSLKLGLEGMCWNMVSEVLTECGVWSH